MALNFPDNPTINQIYSDTTSGFYYRWDGTVWQSFSPGSSSNIRILDDISGSFNGVTTSFSLTSNGTAITPINSQQLVINLGGAVQDPSDDYSVNVSNIVFSTAPNSGLTFSGISLGPAVPISNIIDGSVVPQDLSTGGPWWQSDYKVGIGTSAPTSLLDVEGDAIVSGILTANTIITGAVGSSQTSLVVQGNARITGILTIGTASITFNGNNNTINVGSGITFNGSTGIISATEFRGNGANLTNLPSQAAFSAGTLMLFQQTSAPTGWTKQTSHNNKALRVVTGSASSGGSTAFTSVFASRTPSGSVSGSNSGGSVANTTATGSVSGTNSGGSVTGSVSGSNSGGSVNNTTLSESQIPSHTHLIFDQTGQPGSNQAGTRYGAVAIFDNNAGAKSTDSTGGSTAHNHGFTNPSWSGSWTQGTFTNPSWSGSISINAHNHSLTQPTWSGSFSGSAMDFDVQYVDLIIAAKD